jgi:predicted HTH domain antitoxin
MRIKALQETKIQKVIRHEKEMFREVCIDAWTGIKQAGRVAVRWLARWIILPLSVASTFWISIGNPAELPL